MRYALEVVRASHGSLVGVVLFVPFVGACGESNLAAPQTDASVEAGIDAAADGHLDATDASVEVADVTEPGEDAPDADAGADACPVDGDPPGGACEPGERQRAWCGFCGRKQRVCGSSGVWGDFGPCVEDPDAECSPCSSSSAPCGNCGRQAVWCDTSNERCRWVRGACKGMGACAAGSFEARAGNCGAQRELRWCRTDCTWQEWDTACELPPRWEPIAEAPLSPRVDFGQRDGTIWGGATTSTGDVLGDGARYEAEGDVWTPLPPASFGAADAGVDAAVPAVFDPRRAPGIWAGIDELFLFGGTDAFGETLGDGALWSAAQGWRLVSSVGAPSPRSAPAVVETPYGLFVFGGRTHFGPAAAGGALYDRAKDSWTTVADPPFGNRQEVSAVYEPTSGRVVVWGGRAGEGEPPARTGALYDPASDGWFPMADAPVRRAGHVALWEPATERMLVLFGEDGSWPGHRGDGAAYDASTDTWSWLPDVSATGFVPGSDVAVVQGEPDVWVAGATNGAKLDVDALVWAPIPAPKRANDYARGWLARDSATGTSFPVVWGPKGGEALRGYPQ